MLYVILYGCLPLSDENILELLHKAKDQDIFFPEDPEVSDRAIDLMLVVSVRVNVTSLLFKSNPK